MVNNVAMILIFVEFFFVALFLFSLFIRKILDHFTFERDHEKFAEFSEKILDSINNKTLQELKAFSFAEKKMLLKIVEEYDHRISGKIWTTIKKDICLKHLFPVALKYKNSRTWVKRNFAVRCFILSPKDVDEKILLKMLDDKNFLVTAPISNAITAIESKEGVYKLIEKMSQQQGFLHTYYRDVLLKGSKQVFLWIEELAAQGSEASIELVCLDLLEQVYMPLKKIDLYKELESQNTELQLGALKLLSHNPQEINLSNFNFLKSTNPKIRREAINLLPNPRDYETLEKMLEDEDWNVRINAATHLYNLGKDGRKILNEQSIVKNLKAYQAAQYVLKFGAIL